MTAPLKEGDTAPLFEAKTGEGASISLKSYRGKYVVLYFYPKDDTPGCTKEACAFRDMMGTFEKEGAAILGVSMDGPESHRQFAGKYRLNFPLICDEDQQISKAYGVYQMKNTYGIQKMGIVRTTHVIDPDGKIAKIFPKVQVDGHDQEVISFIRSHRRPSSF